jgi:hypothetical protein
MSAQEQPQKPSAKGPNFYSVEREAQAAELETSRIEGQLSVVRSPALDMYFSQLLGGQQYKVIVYRDASNVVAGPFAMPVDGFANPGNEPVALSGTIFVSAKLLADSDERMLAQKIAHAMAHVSLRHATKLNTKMQIADYANTPLVSIADTQVTQHIPLGWQKFAKQYETEADQAAPGILTTLHLDAAAFAAALQ